MNKPGYRVDKARVRAAFERAAPGYDEAAVLQREVLQRLLARLDLIRIAPRVIFDVGAGTGMSTAALARRYKSTRLVALDIALAMLRQAKRRSTWRYHWHSVCADAEALPMAAHSGDLIFSNLTLQWCNDLGTSLGEFFRVLRPGGLLLFTTFGPATLKELRMSWGHVDGYRHVNTFIDMHDIGDALSNAGFADPVMDMEMFTLTYSSVRKLMDDLKTLGAHHVTQGRAPGLTGKQRFAAMTAAYERCRVNGVLPASYEVIYGHAFVPTQPQPKSLELPLASLRRRP